MSIIEQAAKRLEELRRAGVDVPAGTKPREVTTGVTPSSEAETVVELGRPYKKPLVLDPAANRPVRVAPPQARNESSFEQPHRHSRTVEIDLARLADMGYLTPDAPRTQLADEYRVIKRPLLTNALRKSSTSVERGNLILITSAMPGEGKTFTAINLALSMAVELDCTVLLVDADVARPAMLDRLGLPSTKGLLDVLTDPRLDLSDVLLRTNVERLSILPAGTHHPRATELLATRHTLLGPDPGVRWAAAAGVNGIPGAGGPYGADRRRRRSRSDPEVHTGSSSRGGRKLSRRHDVAQQGGELGGGFVLRVLRECAILMPATSLGRQRKRRT